MAGLTRRFLSCHVRSGLPDGLLVATVSEVGFIQQLYIISTAVRSGLPDGLLHWFCHGDVRLVSSNGYMLFPRP